MEIIYRKLIHNMKLNYIVFFTFLTLSINLVFAQKEGETSFLVAGNCGMCKKRIETAAKIDGVKSALWSTETKKITVSFDPKKTNSTKVQQAIAKAGHDTPDFKAPDDVYEKLHECCLYERLDSDHDHQKKKWRRAPRR